ncbi:EamA family transporter [Radiobacillus sp. PE A8.2]|uniref:EamA family transporter n=1 Tax=Radiobacillus sp. PE A8.2 TaxID=3380349 RepID=UPI00388F726E
MGFDCSDIQFALIRLSNTISSISLLISKKRIIHGMNNLLLILLSCLWGSAFLRTKILLEHLYPVSLVFFRCLFGLLFIIPFIIKIKISIRRSITFKFVVVKSLGAAIPWSMVSYALMHLHTSVSGVMNSFAAIFYFYINDAYLLC